MKRALLLTVLAVLTCCTKPQGNNTDNEPADHFCTLSTQDATSILDKSATLNGSIQWKGLAKEPIELGFLIVEAAKVNKGDAQFPTAQQMLDALAENVPAGMILDGSGEGSDKFSKVVGVNPSTKYYVCACATCGDKTYYGEAGHPFESKANMISDVNISDVTASSLTLSFRFEGDDVEEASVNWYTSPARELVDGTSKHTVSNNVYTFNITGLYPEGKYCFNACIETIGGQTIWSGYTEEVTMQRGLVIEGAGATGKWSADITVRAWPGCSSVKLYYSSNTDAFREDYTTGQNQNMTSAGNGVFKTTLTGLTSGTKYWFRAVSGTYKTDSQWFQTND